MNSRCKREIKVLETQKKRALQKEDLTEAAKICNVIGETLSSFGCFDEAIDAHKEEVHLSEAINDVIGVAVGNRKVGECLCELRQFDDAIKHQQKHLKLARSVDNVLEQQRALATLGRTYFVQAEDFDDDPGGTKQCLKKSEKAYFQSLELCNTLSTSLTPKEFLQMKSRLYLNLGLVYEWKQDYKEALKFVSKALLISKEQKLREDTYRCHYTLSGLYLNAKSYQKALQSAKSAVMIGKEMKSKQQELDAQMQLGVTLLRLGEFSSALQALKQVYKASANENPQSIELIIKNLKFAMKGVKLQTRLDSCTSEQERMTLYEHFGDLSYDVMCPEKAIEYYQKQLDVARELRIEDKLIAPIYISIAVTYSECKEYGKALEFYQRELKLRKNDLKEKSSTYCAIGKCLEDLERPYPEIKEIYMKAIECAQSSGHNKTILKAYKDWAEVVKVNEGPIMHENVLKKIATLRQEMEKEGDDSQEAVSSPLDDDGSGDVHLTPDEVEMLESDDEGNDEEENHLSSTSSTKQRTSRESKKKVKKVNERGETPLHVAAINGNIARVEELLKLGADVKARDYCGWQPVHEASNHGFYDIVKLLLEYGSDVNDPGGAHCGGITPLHDASQNGHLKVVKLLLEYNADVYVKCKEGHTPLQLVQTAIRNDEEELTASDSQNSESLLSLRRRVAVLLRDAMTKKKRKSLQRGTNKSVAENRNRLMFEDFPDSERIDDRAGFQENAAESTDDDDDDLSPGIPFKKKKLNPEDDLLQRQLNQSTQEEKDSPESPQSPCIAKPFVPTDTDDLDMNVPRMSSTTNQPDSENDDDDDEIMQLFQQQECSEKLEDEDSNYESMAEDMSPPVVFVNDTTPDAIPSTSVAPEDERPLEVGTSRTKNRPNAGRPNSRTQHKTSSAQRRLQTRINFSRSPSPATNMRSSSPSMFTEGDRRLQDFIIDDESSRKKGKGKQRQSRIDFTVNAAQGTSNSNTNHRPRNSTNTQNRRNLTTANKGPKSSHRQRHIDNYHPIEIQDENDSNVDNRLNTNHIQSTAAASTQPITRPSGPIFRVKVRISNHCLLVPCQQADEKTIKWLIDQASERYYSLTGVATTISLQTQDGAHLNPSDVITNVIDNNEEICGLVLGLKFPPLVEQYTTKCQEKGIDQLDEITEVFSLEEELRSLSLNNMYISTSDIETVFPCISCNVHITAIDVSNSYIGDHNFSILADALCCLPNLTKVNLSSTGITSRSLKRFSQVVCSQPKDEYKLVMKDPPLNKLQYINFSHNTFIDEEVVSDSLLNILQACQTLDDLRMSHCSLTFKSFQRLLVTNTLKSDIHTLDLSYNNFITWNNAVKVVSIFASPALRFLDLSSVLSRQPQNPSLPMTQLTDLFELKNCKIESLTLDDLPSFSLPLETKTLCNLRHISMKRQNGSPLGLNQFLKQLLTVETLVSIDCSCSSSIDENVFKDFMKYLSLKNHIVEDLRFFGCNISSTLPSEIFDSLSHWKDCKLKLLDVSCNEITSNDKNKLLTVWRSIVRNWTGRVSGKNCVLSAS